MSEVNKVSSNASSSFDARINASADSKPQRDSTVQEDGKQSASKDSAPKSPTPNKNQERRDSAVSEMIKALQQEQQVEDVLNYRQNIQELYRQRNQQASEEYMERMKEVRNQQGKEVVEERKETQDVHHKYNERVQDLSRKHLQRMLKHKLEDSTFKDLKKIVDPDDPAETQKPRQSPADNAATKGKAALDKSRLRPEVSQLLSQDKADPTQPTKAENNARPGDKTSPQQTPTRAEAAGDNPLMEKALGKLRQRLGGAHNNPQKQVQQAQRLHSDDQIYAQKQPLRHADAPIRANMGNIQKDIQRARLLRSAADGSRYVPLETRDIKQLLTKHKIPFTHAMVQTIKQTSHKLQDSSYLFMQAASVLAQVGVEVTPERADIVRGSLQLYEQYQRPSIMHKLYRFLINSRYLEVYRDFKAHGAQRDPQRVQDLGRSLFDPQSGKRLDSEGSTREYSTLTFRTAKNTQGPAGLQVPVGAGDEALRSAVKAQLKDLGLPANRVMVRQIVQSAEGDVQRAQALLLQLASGGSLAQPAVEKVYQGLLQLPADQQEAGPLELMKALNITIPERLLQQSNPARQKLTQFTQDLGFPLTRLADHPRAALEQLQGIAEKTQIGSALIAQLSKAMTTRPDFWIKQLGLHLERLEGFHQTLNQDRFSTPSQQKQLAQTLILALEMPENRLRAWERVKRLIGELSTEALPPTDTDSEAAEAKASSAAENAAKTSSRLRSPAQILARYGALAFDKLNGVVLQNQAKEAILILHNAAEQQGLAKSFRSQLAPLLTQDTTGQLLYTLAQQLPHFQEQLQKSPQAQLSPQFLNQVIKGLKTTRATQPTAAENDILKQYPALESLGKQWPEGMDALKASLLLLHTQSEKGGQPLQATLQSVLQQASQQLMAPAATLPTALTYLTELLPQLQAQTLSQDLRKGDLQQLHDIFKAFLLQDEAQSPPSTKPLQSSPFTAVLSRFYPQLPAEAQATIAQQLQNASPLSLKGFFQLHQVLEQMDPVKSQSLGSLWQTFAIEGQNLPAQSRLLERLAHLSQGLSPLLNQQTGSQTGNKAAFYLMPAAQQNQWIQALQSYFQSGQTAPLKPLLTAALNAPLHLDPSGKVKEQLQAFQLPAEQLNPATLKTVWQLAQGSRLRIDAMGVLLKGNLPLLEQNISLMANQLASMPTTQRPAMASDLLLQLTGQLQQGPPSTLAQAQVRNPLTQLRTLLESPLPLLAEHFNPASTAQLPAQQVALSQQSSPNVLLQLLENFGSQLPIAQQQNFTPLMQAVQNILQQLNGLIPSTGVTSAQALQHMQQALQQLQQLLPNHSAPLQQLFESFGRTPSHALQNQLTGFLHEVGLLRAAVDKRLQLIPQGSHSASTTGAATPGTEALVNAPSLLLPEGDLNSETLQKYLTQWGIPAQSAESLQQILQLMQGQQERLDAMAILLKGNMPLLPAHIQVVAQYVKKLPPQERFQSISKVLSFLSDALIAQMQGELKQQRQADQRAHQPQLSQAEAEAAEPHLLQAKKEALRQHQPLSEQSYTSAQLSAQLKAAPGPQQGSNASPTLLQNLMHNTQLPEHLFLPLERILGQLQSLFPRYEAPVELQQLHDTFQHLKTLLQPQLKKGPELQQWLQKVGSEIQQWDKTLRQQVQRLAQHQNVSFEEDHWIDSLLESLLGLSEQLEAADPQKAQQLQKLRQNIQEQLGHFRQNLQAMEQGSQPLAEPLQYIPAYLEQLGMPVEVLVQPPQADKDPDGETGGEGFSEVLLNVKTHSLGDVHLQLRFDPQQQRLSARMGLASGQILRQIQPLLGSFQQTMKRLPFEVAPLQTYIVPPQQQGQTVMARRLYQRLGQTAIQGL